MAKTKTVTLMIPAILEFDPQPNITTFELAVIIKLIGKPVTYEIAQALGSGLRHFEIIEDKQNILKGLVHRRP